MTVRFLLAAAILAHLPGAGATPEQVAERMLASLGGRDAWARAKNTVNDSRQDWDGEPPELRVVITMDFERPRLRIETRGKDLHLVRVVDGEDHWRLSRAGTIEPVSAETLAIDRRFWAGHVYRTLHRIAARDPALRLALGAEGRLEVHEAGARIAWYALDRRGQPYRYGAHDDEVGGIFGPWDHEVAGIRHPVWVTRDNGKWRAMLKRLEVNVALEPELFARPESAAAMRRQPGALPD
jgi:hypothetical protein